MPKTPPRWRPRPQRRPQPRGRVWWDKLVEGFKRFVERFRDKSEDKVNPAEPQMPAPPPPRPRRPFRPPFRNHCPQNPGLRVRPRRREIDE